jgi:uncharacterized protein with von Willebrand factor type A (vWA) domain
MLAASARMRSVLGSSGRCSGWPKPGSLAPRLRMSAAMASVTAAVASPASTRRFASTSRRAGVLGRAEDHRAAAEDARRQRALERWGSAA